MSLQLNAQQYILENYGLANGLNSPKVETIIQDSQGFIWIGTYQGLSRFDGNEFVNYTSVDGQRIGTVFSIVEIDRGVILFAGMEGIFVHKDKDVHLTPWVRSDTENHSVNELKLDKNKNIWVASTLGPYIIPYTLFNENIGSSSSTKDIRILNAWQQSELNDKRCGKIAFDTTGNLWLANDYYLTKYQGDSLQVLYDAYGKKSLKISSLFPQSSESIIWSAQELYMYQTSNGYTDTIWTSIKYPSSVIKSGNNNYYVITDKELFIIDDNKPRIILNTSEHGIYYPRVIVIDSEKNLWISSHSGLYKLIENKVKYVSSSKHPSASEIYGIENLRSGKLLLGANHGKIYSAKTDKTSEIKLFEELDIRSEIVDFYEETEKRLWIASNYQGLVLHENGQTIRFTENDGLLNSGLRHIFKSSKNDIWVAGELGVSKIIEQANGDINFKKYIYGNPIANYFTINKIIEGPDNQLWFGSNFGLFHLHNDSIKPYALDIPDSNELYIFDCIMASNGLAYFASGNNGIITCQFNKSNRPVIQHLTNKDNGVSTNTFVSLIETKSGQIWAAGYNEICLIDDIYNTDSNLPVCFNQNNGYILDTYSSVKMEEDELGRIWLATPSGLAYFDPKTFSFNSQAPYVHIYDFLVDGRSEDLIKYGKGIDSATGFVQELKLPYHKNYISFKFNAISLKDLNNLNYTYQLIGTDKEPLQSTSNSIINYPNLPSGEYTFTVNASNSFGVSRKDPISYAFEIKPAFWRTKWFIGGSLLISFLAIRYYFKRKESIYKRVEEEKNKVNKLIADLKIRAIRSQMNPHFIFNCLNAIQSCIAAQEPDVATTYLLKFSRLLRMVLNYSEKDYISMDQEIEFLSLYLDLEKLRFGKSLEYFIEIPNNIDQEEYVVPSFLIQPFVENSIWHGLMHKQNDRKLWIRFNITNEQGLLECIIEDNGIGRQKSALIKNKNIRSIAHQSKGMKLSTDRIELIKLQSQEKINLEIKDLKDENNTPIGTKVILKLPINYEN